MDVGLVSRSYGGRKATRHTNWRRRNIIWRFCSFRVYTVFMDIPGICRERLGDKKERGNVHHASRLRPIWLSPFCRAIFLPKILSPSPPFCRIGNFSFHREQCHDEKPFKILLPLMYTGFLFPSHNQRFSVLESSKVDKRPGG